MDDEPVFSETGVSPALIKTLKLSMQVFVSDLSFGALSDEAKIAPTKGAEISGTGICNGEGSMLPEEQENNSRYFS